MQVSSANVAQFQLIILTSLLNLLVDTMLKYVVHTTVIKQQKKCVFSAKPFIVNHV